MESFQRSVTAWVVFAFTDESGKPLIAGRTVTGFANIEETLSGIKSQVPFSLQMVSLNVVQTTKKHLFRLPRMWFQTKNYYWTKPTIE